MFLIGDDGHIKAAEAFTCESDEDACSQARAILTNCPMLEVWCLDRKVAIIPNTERPVPAMLQRSPAPE